MKLNTPNTKTAIIVNGEKRDGWEVKTLARMNPSIFEGSSHRGYDWSSIGITLYTPFGKSKKAKAAGYAECDEIVRIFSDLEEGFKMPTRERDQRRNHTKREEFSTLAKTVEEMQRDVAAIKKFLEEIWNVFVQPENKKSEVSDELV